VALSGRCGPPQPFYDPQAGSRIPAFFHAITGGIFVDSQFPTKAFVGTNPTGEVITSVLRV
jgi:hypothetical protein